MNRDSAQELVTFVQNERGDQVRSVAYFKNKEREVLYARDDVVEQYSENEIQSIFTDLSFDALGKGHTEEMYIHGELMCIARFFEEAIELHFLHEDRSGTAVALEPNAINDLGSIIQGCLSEL